MKIYVTGKLVGEVVSGEFRKTVRGSIHFLRKPPAIAFDEESIHQAAGAGARVIVVTDKDTCKVYRATMKDLKQYGVEFDRGYGQQIFLPFNRWNRPEENLHEQADLFCANK